MYQFIVKPIYCTSLYSLQRIWIQCLKRNNSNVRVRFAPSPTGFVHIGGLRTALYNYLFAKNHNNGKFILRIEDTDQTRIVPGATEHLLSILEWAGVVPDESPLHGGNYGPYVQSQRLSYYNKYDNRCRYLSKEKIEENLALAKPYAVRLKIENSFLAATDMLFGEIKLDSGSIGDPVIMKSDGFPTYHLANVVDDHLMGITHVIRGREWLISTPNHVLIYEKFGWDPPQFMHLPLLINSDGSKLSKRQNDANVEHFKDSGYSPSALINFMVYCGSGFKGLKFPIFTQNHSQLLRRLTASFDPQTLLQSDAVVDVKKLEDFSRTLTCHLIDTSSQTKIRELIHDLFDAVLKKYGDECFFIQDNLSPDDIQSYLYRIMQLRKTHIIKPNDLVSDPYDFLWLRPTINDECFQFKEALFKVVEFIESLDFECFVLSSAQSRLKNIAESLRLKFAEIMKFLRVCLTGKKQGPTLFDIILMLGKKETLLRLHQADERLKQLPID